VRGTERPHAERVFLLQATRNAIGWMPWLLREQPRFSTANAHADPGGQIETTLELFPEMAPAPIQNAR